MSAPTRSTRAIQAPETTTLPENNSSPGVFRTGTDSPVSRDSSVSISPSSTRASAGICIPLSREITSPSTSSSTGSSRISPSRRTRAFGAVSTAICSTSFLAWSSWTIPMTVFSAMIRINRRLDHAPTSASAMAIRTLNRLNRVHTCSRII